MKWSLLCITLISMICRLEAKRDFVVEFLDGNITVLDSDYAKSVNYHIYDEKAIYVDFILKKDVTDFDIALKAFLIKDESRPTSLLNIKLNGCESLKGGMKDGLMNLIFSELVRVTNLPKKCPLLADNLYYFKNFTMNEEVLPLVVPLVNWRLEADFIIDKSVKAKGFLKGCVRKV